MASEHRALDSERVEERLEISLEVANPIVGPRLVRVPVPAL
jgi:hypothetical protein